MYCIKTFTANGKQLLIRNFKKESILCGFSVKKYHYLYKTFTNNYGNSSFFQIKQVTICSCYINKSLYLGNPYSQIGFGTKTGDVQNSKTTEQKRSGILSEINIEYSTQQNTTSGLKILPISSPESNKITQIYYDDNDASREAQKLFVNPKNMLHNIFYLVSKEINKPSLHLTPSYRQIKDHKKMTWICIYKIGWPKEMKFMAKDVTKKVASEKAALAALTWLRQERKITDQGAPLIYDKEEIKQISRKTYPVITLDEKTIEKMKNIIEVHNTNMLPIIESTSSEIGEGSILGENSVPKEDEDMQLTPVKKQIFLGSERYSSKEKVELPIAAFKNKIKEHVVSHQVLIIKGEPGCGKSTRVPQYVLEAWAEAEGLQGEPGRVVVTQPRRIAAISLAERVASERDEFVGDIVGYQVRLNSKFRSNTGRILYCTTGILLRHLQSDSKLSGFTHIILDEAHERDVNTDLLMNLLRSAIRSNPKLKLIVMSATIDTNMFSEYYDNAPVLEIPGFTYPVKQHFLDDCVEIDLLKTLKMCEGDVPSVIHEDVVNVLKYIQNYKKEGAILCFLPGWDDIIKIKRLIPERRDLSVHCLHSRLDDYEQRKIFSRPPPGVRKIILATNIAETSVTVDDVVYVVDTGIHKDQRFDVGKGVKCIDNHWISKASAHQRKGRAGRCQPGECFHLYPSSKYEAFQEYSLPEMMRTSLTKIVLDSKVFSNNMNALEFMGKLPTPPEKNAIKAAVEELTDLALLDEEEKLTSLGETLADFQLEPKLGKAMVNAVIFKCVTPIVDIVTLFSADSELFVSGLMAKDEAKSVKTRFSGNSDHLAMMRLFEKYLEYSADGDFAGVRQFCESANLLSYKMGTLEKLRNIHFDYLHDGLNNVIPVSDDHSDNDELVKAVLYSGVGNVLQHRDWDIVKNRFKNNTNVLLTRHNQKATIAAESVNYKRNKFPSDYLLYINETRSNIRRTTIVRECSIISKISMLLFSNHNLKIQEMKDVVDSESENQIQLVLEGTNIKLICDRMHAEEIIKCKRALMSSYRYFVSQLTKPAERNEAASKAWNDILNLVTQILIENGVNDRR
ncbi:unnamed protein product [Phaedon cochleariae]|uniref:RNA helicase n=1 Tax=Phaedon cochleariae TaxID=80249 RepID=A0A9P0DU72_PHACE|nr:unnamed protein product [Phaedon cochleariae]